MRIVLVICLAFLIVSPFFCEINGSKSKEPKEILKEIISNLEKCAKSNKNEATKKLVQKCLSDIKMQKNFLDKKDKSMKDIFKKVVIKLLKCMKTGQSKNSKKIRRKRFLEDLPNEVLEQIFGDLSPYDLMKNVVEVCPRFKEIVIKMFSREFDKPLWKEIKFTEIDALRQDISILP